MGANPQGSIPSQPGGKRERGTPPFHKNDNPESQLAAAPPNPHLSATLHPHDRGGSCDSGAKRRVDRNRGAPPTAPTTPSPQAPTKRPGSGPPARARYGIRTCDFLRVKQALCR